MSALIDKYNEYKGLSRIDKANYKVDQSLKFCLNRNNLEWFLTGELGDTFQSDDSITPINYPVIFSCIYRNHAKTPELKIDEKFIEAVIRLLSGAPIRVYFGINALRYHTYYQKQGLATFEIKDIKIYELAKEAIKKNEEQLKILSIYEGKNHEDKMYGYIKECGEQIENNSGNKIL